MPVYGRFLIEGTPRHAEIQDGKAYLIDDLFGARRRTGGYSPLDKLQILAPVAPAKLFAIGLNYHDHALESGKPVPDVPLMWFKSTHAIIAQHEAVEIAYPEHRTDYEGELTVIIGKRCKGATEENALGYVLGYTNGQDISDRDVQRSESQWARAKSFDTYAPLGPFIYTDLDPTNLTVETRLNGEVRQRGNTSQMIFPVAKLIAFLSEAITLEPGDCIMTGTPEGIGPLRDGDVIETRIGSMEPLLTPVTIRR
ncbi:MAG TPA: fumarylacetoacetate hydrolase family protein [Abditibacteriaceae bacterium]|jgi:2-keto-4-pentenoate hydratase/2-oxohepta-3-ene-1,7-dioic acid hydratase in catechol pathway